MIKDLTFDGAYGKFNVRVAVLVENNKRFLLQNQDDNYWLIGGRVGFNEDSKEAMIREISEELCYQISDKDSLKLNFICENFFMWDDKTPCHEVLFIYRLILSDVSELTKKDNFACGDNPRFKEKWVRFEDLSKISLVPKFIPEFVTHRDFKHCVIRNHKIS